MTTTTTDHTVVSHRAWTEARVALLQKEKEFVRLRDQISQQIRSLPWERAQKEYLFEGRDGRVGLGDLFGSHSQLIVYHFMFDAGWPEGCPSCSLITDSLEPTAVHLGARDVALTLVSRAPIEQILTFQKRMGWKLPWVSSQGTEFNNDYQVTTGDPNADGEFFYNYEMMSRYPPGEQPGLSVFRRNPAGEIFHTYSTYARGLETFMSTYSLLDVVPKGRDEEDLAFGMEWVRHKDRYGRSPGEEAAGCCKG